MRDLSLRREAAALYMIDGRLLLYDSPPITNASFVSLLSVLFLSVQLLSLVTLSFVNVGFEEARAILTPFTSKLRAFTSALPYVDIFYCQNTKTSHYPVWYL